MKNDEPQSKRRLSQELGTMFRFGLVGLANTGLTAGIMVLLDLTGIPYIVYTTIGYVAGIVCSFLLNRWFTFSAGKDQKTIRFLRFVVTCLILLGVAQVVQYILIEQLQLPKTIGIAIGMVVYTGLGYILNRLWVFAKKDTI